MLALLQLSLLYTSVNFMKEIDLFQLDDVYKLELAKFIHKLY